MRMIVDKNSITKIAAERDKATKAAKAAKAVEDAVKKIAAKDADQYMLRLPPGLRDRVARRAADNGRSMNTEIVEAIERHLTSADRVTQLWELFGKHQENIEAIPRLLSAVEAIELYLSRAGDGDTSPFGLSSWIRQKERDAYLATLPLVTAEEVQTIKALLKETESDEKRFLAAMRVPRIEDIRDFQGAKGLLRRRLPVTAEQVQTIKALLKDTESDEKEFLAVMGVPRIEDISLFEFDRAEEHLKMFGRPPRSRPL
jgi:hypothetical protein